ncbi:hypothetical protein RRG08_009556 [Elysia crispata]|uniref:Uncharacterized protein n=1 Tax=Elysia crispata TaxID=231223 RepID=A0AAE0ZH99_9GAST|nr:hypothetical protein RRG08_009556 [Elysia crispata]
MAEIDTQLVGQSGASLCEAPAIAFPSRRQADLAGCQGRALRADGNSLKTYRDVKRARVNSVSILGNNGEVIGPDAL